MRSRALRRTLIAMLMLSTIPIAYAAGPAPNPAQARFEVRFMETMVDHHGMAIEMADICFAKALRPSTRNFGPCQNVRIRADRGNPKDADLVM